VATFPLIAGPAAEADRPVAEPQYARPAAQPKPSRWGRFLAFFRLSLVRVCVESAALGEYDYHGHRDDADGAAWHVEGRRRCARCGKWYRLY
jgi:hypothetical protein